MPKNPNTEDHKCKRNSDTYQQQWWQSNTIHKNFLSTSTGNAGKPQPTWLPEPLPNMPQITATQIKRIIAKLSPYKAHSPDSIPNIVLQLCADLLIGQLTKIYRSIIKHEIYYDKWGEYTTVVLQKSNKPNYETLKAYRPIALISTMAKVLTMAVAETSAKWCNNINYFPRTTLEDAQNNPWQMLSTTSSTKSQQHGGEIR